MKYLLYIGLIVCFCLSTASAKADNNSTTLINFGYPNTVIHFIIFDKATNRSISAGWIKSAYREQHLNGSGWIQVKYRVYRSNTTGSWKYRTGLRGTSIFLY